MAALSRQTFPGRPVRLPPRSVQDDAAAFLDLLVGFRGFLACGFSGGGLGCGRWRLQAGHRTPGNGFCAAADDVAIGNPGLYGADADRCDAFFGGAQLLSGIGVDQGLALRIDVVGLAAGRQALATIDDDPAIGHGDDLWRADDLGDIADDFVQEPVQGRAELVAAGAEAAGIGPTHGAGGRFDQGVAHRGTGRCRDLAVGFTRQVDEFFLDLGGYAGLRQVDDQHEIGAQRLAELATLFVGGLIAFEQAQLLADGAVVAAIQHGEAAALDELVGQRLAQPVGVGALAQSSGGDDGDAVALGLWRLGLELDLFDRHFQVDLAALVLAGLPDDLVALDLALAGHAVLAADAGFERGARGPRAFD